MTSWFDLIPVFGAVVTIIGISLKAGRLLQKPDNVIEEVMSTKTDLKEHSERIAVIENKVTGIEKRLG